MLLYYSWGVENIEQLAIRGENFQLFENHGTSNSAQFDLLVEIKDQIFEMELFEIIKIHLSRLGIFQVELDYKTKIKAVTTRCALYIIYVTFFISSAWYRIFEAQTPIQQSESLTFVLSSAILSTWYLALDFQSEKYATILDKLNTIIAKSKFSLILFLRISVISKKRVRVHFTETLYFI